MYSCSNSGATPPNDCACAVADVDVRPRLSATRPTEICVPAAQQGQGWCTAMNIMSQLLRFDGRVALVTGAGGGKNRRAHKIGDLDVWA